MWCEFNPPFSYGKRSDANSWYIGDRLLWFVQVSLSQLPRPLCHPGPKKVKWPEFQTSGWMKTGTVLTPVPCCRKHHKSIASDLACEDQLVTQYKQAGYLILTGTC